MLIFAFDIAVLAISVVTTFAVSLIEFKREDELIFIWLLLSNWLFLEISFYLALTFFFVPFLPIDNLWLIATSSASTLVCSFLVILFIFKPKLLETKDSGENAHVYTKYISIYEMLTTSGLAFLIGIFPIFISHFHISESSEIYIIGNTILTWLSCLACASKCLLSHTYSVWKANCIRAKEKLPPRLPNKNKIKRRFSAKE